MVLVLIVQIPIRARVANWIQAATFACLIIAQLILWPQNAHCTSQIGTNIGDHVEQSLQMNGYTNNGKQDQTDNHLDTYLGVQGSSSITPLSPYEYSDEPSLENPGDEQLSSISHESDFIQQQQQHHHQFHDREGKLNKRKINETCKLARGYERRKNIENVYLDKCDRHRVVELWSKDVEHLIMHKTSETCEMVLEEFIELDQKINKFYEMFESLLKRYNCKNGYSVKWSCDDCKKAYKDWLCTTNLPYHMNMVRIKPCISFCERVEQRCPYFHPITKEQYGGQPAFICRDPNIPFVPEITPDILHSDPGSCYDLCHLTNDTREIDLDSLSKYDKNCPSSRKIAEETSQVQVKLNSLANKQENDLESSQTDSVIQTDSNQDIYSSNPMPEDSLEQEFSIPNKTLDIVYIHRQKLAELNTILERHGRNPSGSSFKNQEHR